MTYTEACLAINMIPKIGPVRLRRLLGIFGEPQAILRAPADRLSAVEGIGPELARRIVTWQEAVDLPAELQKMQEAGIHALTAGSELYPTLLRDIHDPPIVLYVWGELLPTDARGFGVVGSRQSSFYGTEISKKLSYQLASAGYTIFSGLARGIDTAAHQGAVAAKGRTVAVLGCGLSQIYPPENFVLAERIAEGHGAVVSEFPMSVTPDRTTFPMRNRIISGCSQGVLVVEAGLQSGALISANQAAEQGRIVFAVPGQIDRPSSQGTNRLIQQGAKLVMDAEDILEELTALPGLAPAATRTRSSTIAPPPTPANSLPAEPPQSHPGPPDLQFTGNADAPNLAEAQANPAAIPTTNLTSDEQTILAAVGHEETPVDRVIASCGLPTPVVSSTLFALQLKKLIKQLPGKHYVRLA